jgi:putative hydrolase of the HAD superfamily
MMLPALSGTKAIFFDLDDTLCAYWDASKAALRKTFEALAPPGVSPEQMLMAWAAAFRDFSPALKESEWYPTYLKCGEPTRTEQMRRCLQELGIRDDALSRRLSERYAAERDAELKLFPDAIEVLATLSARYPLGLLTNGPADVQRQEIETLGIERFFRVILIEGEMGVGKPHPDVFRQATASLGFEPHEMVFVGNHYHHDIAPALERGWKAIWIRRPSDVPPSATGREEPVKTAGPELPATAIVSSLSELLPLFG